VTLSGSVIFAGFLPTRHSLLPHARIAIKKEVLYGGCLRLNGLTRFAL
jgi:hypothetical protein